MKRLLIAAVVLVAPTAVWAQDVEAGASLFRQCGASHKIGPGATKFVGPELNGLDGRKAGSTDYAYSDAMKNSGITWDADTFKEYIMAPKTKVPGTKMTYPGINGDGSDKKIANLWAYLKQFNADGSKKAAAQPNSSAAPAQPSSPAAPAQPSSPAAPAQPK